MKKSKLFKTISFSSLALLMGAAGVFAFAPLGANPSLASANTFSDEINTKADGENIKYAPSALGLDPENDPVIYITESGLEIKYGGLNLQGSLESGALTGYPYFTMGTYNNANVNWIIIGRNANVTTLNSTIQEYVFSTWKNNNTNNSGWTFGKYFFEKTYETNTPAGNAINTDTSSKGGISDNLVMSISGIKDNAEIPSGCILAVSEKCLGTTTHSRYYYSSPLKTACQNLFDTGLQLTESQKDLIQPINLISTYYGCGNNNSNTYQTNQRLLPLAWRVFNTATYNGSQDNFCWEFYMPLTYSTSGTDWGLHNVTSGYQYMVSDNIYWIRNSAYNPKEASYQYINASGIWSATTSGTAGVRPACVIKI